MTQLQAGQIEALRDALRAVETRKSECRKHRGCEACPLLPEGCGLIELAYSRAIRAIPGSHATGAYYPLPIEDG